MPYCPKCCAKLTKRKSNMSYVCQYHGHVRYVQGHDPAIIQMNQEQAERLKGQTVTIKKTTHQAPPMKAKLGTYLEREYHAHRKETTH